MLLSNKAPSVYLISWCIVSFFELYFILAILFKLLSKQEEFSDFFYITLLVLSIPVIAATVLSFSKRSYVPVNTADAYNQLLLMLGSIIILKKLLSKDIFIKNLESFFVFSGFVLYFGLHTLVSNVIFFDFLKNWNFAQFATFLSLSYWLGSSVLIWKIRQSLHLF
jgi:hypothetical protein